MFAIMLIKVLIALPEQRF